MACTEDRVWRLLTLKFGKVDKIGHTRPFLFFTKGGRTMSIDAGSKVFVLGRSHMQRRTSL